ncbi:winged helix DNA-binding domain-containing protein [Actinophytocola sp. S1-96]|uniref:Winged helix DNA-binding domain-containing protein n=1 Tax=Actinophytocola gossypii TaxID=2812003 RepID=A0ABT2JH68_9PSEU|nr:winged helix DNA-binding domain-containing protein [Actinophytocola gossypii]
MHAAVGSYFAARGAPRRRRSGLDDALLERAATALETVLGEPTTRGVLVERLRECGVELDPTGQAPADLLAWGANVGLVCRGPDTANDEPTYVLMGRLPRVEPDEALATLARRYLAGYAPATAGDLGAWSGPPVTWARRVLAAIGDLTETVDADGREAFVLKAEGEIDDTSTVRLVGHFDAYLLGYRGRELAVPNPFANRIQAGGGFVMPAVVHGGLVVGTWRSHVKGDVLRVELDVWRKISGAIGNEVVDLGRFLGVRTSTS